MEVVKDTFLNTNVALLHIVALPIAIIGTWLFGTFEVWGSLLVVYILFLVRRVADKKIGMWRNLMKDVVNKDRETETVDWLNMFLRKYWVSCIPNLVAPHIDNLQHTLRENKPAFLESLAIGEWSLGDRPPRFDVIYPNLSLGDEHNQMDIQFHWVSDFHITLVLSHPSGRSFHVRVDNFKFRGLMRLDFKFNTVFPSSSVIGVSFMEEPIVDFSVKPMSTADLISIPMVHDLIENVMKVEMGKLLMWPRQLTFTMGGGAPEDIFCLNDPIVDIGLVALDELNVAKGWIVLEKACCGTIPASLNRGDGAKDVFLCYKRQPKNLPAPIEEKPTEEKPAEGEATEGAASEESETSTAPAEEAEVVEPIPDPITGLSIVYPSKGEPTPTGFVALNTTVLGGDGNLNLGTKGPVCYLAISREPIAAPITQLSILNTSTAVDPPLNHTKISLTPHGRDANVNSFNEDEGIYICYKGGAESIMGHASGIKHRGLLRVHIDSARDIKVSDVGGTSDPYCVAEICGSTGKPHKTRSIEKTLAPKWDETFIVAASSNDVIQFYVYDKDAIGKDDFLGGIRLSLNTLVCGKEIVSWYPLIGEGTGEIRIGICALDFARDTPLPRVKLATPLPMIQIDEKYFNEDPDPTRHVRRPMIEVNTLHNIAEYEEEDIEATAEEQDEAQTAANKGKWAALGNKAKLLNAVKDTIENTYFSQSGSMKLGNQGILSKEKTAWFVLNEGCLVQYKNEKAVADNKDPTDEFPLANASVEVDESKQCRMVLKDATSRKKWELTTTTEDFSDWLKHIRGNIRVASTAKQ